MSFLSVVPEMVTAAAGNLEGIGSALTAANAAVATSTTGVAAPGADAVSAAIATVFGTHGQQYQSLGAQLTAFHERFVGALNAGMSQYLGTDAASARQSVVNSVNTPALFERSAIRVGAAEASFASAMGSPVFGIGGGAKASIAVSGGAGGIAVTTPPVTTPPVGAPPVGPGPVTPPASPPPTGTPVTLPVVNQSTPLGQVQLTLTGTVDPSTGAITVQSGSLVLPSPIALAIDAVGAPYNAVTALGNSGLAFNTALRSGNLMGAVTALGDAPGDAVHSFLYGQQTLTVSEPGPAGSGISQLGVSIPTDGLLVNSPDLAMVTLTPTGGSPSVVPLTGVQFSGLGPALQQLGGLPTSMQAAAAQALPVLGGGVPPDGPFTATVFDQQTPFGEVSLSLSGVVFGGQVTLTGGSVVAPPQLALAVDALGAPYDAYLALGPGGPALVNAVQTGNVAGALGILAHAPGDVWHEFLYGQQTLTVSESAPAGSGFSQVGVSIPMDGLLVHGPDAVTVSVTPPGGSPTVVALSGAQISGLGPALQQLAGLPTSMQAAAAQALPVLGGGVPPDGPFTATVFDQQTPFGEVSLSLSGTVSMGQLTLTGGSVVAPPQLALAMDALGAPYDAYLALGPGGPALVNAVQTGNVAGAVGILAHAPGDVWHEFLYGQQTLTLSEPGPAGSGISQVAVNIPMDGLLVHGPDLATVSATPTGGSPSGGPLTGVQFSGLGPALQQLGGLPTSMQAAAAQALPVLGGGVPPDGPFTATVFDQQTPFGEVSLSLSGVVFGGQVTLTGGSVVAPPQLALAVDALGAPYDAYLALGPGGPALVNAVQTGNVAGALGILAHAPGDVWHEFLYGQQTLTVSEAAPSGSGFSQVGVSIPMDGLLVHGPDAVTVSATPPGGSPTVVALSGAQISGLGPALQQLAGLPTSMQAAAAQALPVLGGGVPPDGPFTATVFDQQTPFGEVSLSLSGTVSMGQVTLTGGSLVAPQSATLLDDAFGAPYDAYLALGSSGPAFVNAVQGGNVAGALGILAHAPSDVWHEFLYGQQTLTVSEPAPDGSGFSQLSLSIPMDGLLVHGPDLATVSATPTGGSPSGGPLTGVQFSGLVPALQQLGGGLPTSMQAVAGHALPLLGVGSDGSFTTTVFDQQTPLGEVSLSLSGTVSDMGQVTLTGASLVAPQSATLAVDALGAPYDAYLALGPNGPAFVGDLQSGNVLGAVNILAHSPGDVWHEFLYGQQTLTVSEAAPSDSGFSQVGVSIPMDGLLVQGSEVATVTATPTSGPPSVVPLTGAQFGGLVAALEDSDVLANL